MTKEIQKSSSKYIVAVAFAAIAAALYLFWAFPYRAALGYREEMQLFQTTGAYLDGLAARPAGISVYIGEFLTQFFNNFWIGAAVMAGILILFLFLMRSIIRVFAPAASKTIALLLAIVPLTALWLFLGNPDVTVGFSVALIISLASVQLFVYDISDFGKCDSYVHMLAMTSFLYWIAGPVSIIFTLLITIYAFRTLPSFHAVIFPLASILWLTANFLMWSPQLPYPISYQLIGIGLLYKPDLLPVGQVVVESLCVGVPLLSLAVARISGKIAVPSLAGLAIVAVIFCYPYSYDSAVYRLIDYDYLVRANDWDDILRYSDRHDPDLPLSVSATNLALGMTGQLDARAFDYFQNGAEGLIPPFTKETLSSWTTGEVMFQLGLLNSAQRFYFEGMEAIPNYNKSVRAVKRLAETAMIRGEYTLAGKYLKMLENTIFYRNWARRNMELIKDPQAVAAHPLYGTLRNRMVDEDYLFSEGELDKTLGQLFIKDSSNSLAKQYLIVYPLLQRDLNKFGQYMGVVAESHLQYNPPLAQQALAFMAMKNGQPIPQGAVSPVVEQSLRGFAQAWTSKNPDLIAQHRRTLYHYLISNE
ncbi:MAG: hypothetical protein K2L00_10080 [Muribaculaceae bacterium]|nr:hypothetical protein [Muribaculaceae bacterium]